MTDGGNDCGYRNEIQYIPLYGSKQKIQRTQSSPFSLEDLKIGGTGIEAVHLPVGVKTSNGRGEERRESRVLTCNLCRK